MTITKLPHSIAFQPFSGNILLPMQIIEVTLKSHLPDARGQGLVKDIQDLGITTVTDAHVADIYWLNAELPQAQLERIGRDLLADPVTQDFICYTPTGKRELAKTTEISASAC